MGVLTWGIYIVITNDQLQNIFAQNLTSSFGKNSMVRVESFFNGGSLQLRYWSIYFIQDLPENILIMLQLFLISSSTSLDKLFR